MKRFILRVLTVLAATLGFASAAWAERVENRVISINFGNQGAATADSGLVKVPASAWNNFTAQGNTRSSIVAWNGTANETLPDTTTITWSCPKLYQYTSGVTDPILKGYLDDGGDGSQITINGIPFEKYRVVIYQATDSENHGFNPPAVNGTYYSHDGESTSTTRNDSALKYGQSRQATPVIGKNVVQPGVLFSGTLTIVGGGNTNKARGCIAAIQIVEIVDTTDRTLVLSEDKTWAEVLDAAGVTEADRNTAILRLTAAEGATPAITFETAANTIGQLAVVGPVTFKAADALYEDGCFRKTLLTAQLLQGALTTPNATSAIKEGFKGQIAVSGRSLILSAQNREVISINIGGGKIESDSQTGTQSTPEANLVTGSAYYGLYPVPGDSWNNIDKKWRDGPRTVTLSAAKSFDGATTTTRNSITLSGTAVNTWEAGLSTPFLRGYLDDSGSGVEVKVTGVPYSKYDVIVYVTSDSSQRLRPICVNGTWWTYSDDGVLVQSEGANGYDGAVWGEGLKQVPEFGKNAMLITDLTSPDLTVKGFRPSANGNGQGGRATICAVQLIQRGDLASMDWSADLTGTTAWRDGAGDGIANASATWVNGAVNTIALTTTAEAEATLTFDTDVTAAVLKVVCPEGKTLHLAKDEGVTLNIAAYNLAEAAGTVIFDFDPDMEKVDTGAYSWKNAGFAATGVPKAGVRYLAKNNKWNFDTGYLSAGNYWLGGSGTAAGGLKVANGANVTIAGDYDFSGLIGGKKGTITIAEDATVTAPQIFGGRADGTHLVVTVAGSLTLTTASDNSDDDRNNLRGILFNEYPNTSFELNVTGTLLAPNIVLTTARDGNGGAIRVNGGTLRLKGIIFKRAPCTLDVTNGGVLEMQQAPTGQNYCVYTFNGGTLRAAGDLDWTPATMEMQGTGNAFDANGHTLAIRGSLTGDGAIAFVNSAEREGVVDLRTARPTGELTLGEKVTLKVELANDSESPSLKFAAGPPEGAIRVRNSASEELSNAGFAYNAETKMLTISAGIPTWTKGTSSAFEAEGNWSGPMAEASAVIVKVDGDTEIEVRDDHAFAKMTIAGTGRAILTGQGNFTVGNTEILEGAALVYKPGSNFGIYAGEGTLVVADGTLTISNGTPHEQTRCLGVRHIRIEANGLVSIEGRDSFTRSADDAATLTVEAGGKLSAGSFTALPKVYLNGGTIESTGSWGSQTTWASVCYAKGVVAGGATTSYLKTTVPENVNAGHQLATGTFEVGQGATLQVDVTLRNGPGDRGTAKNKIVKTGPGQMVVNVAPSMSGLTEVQEGRYVLNATHNISSSCNYKVSSGAALTGTGSITGSGSVELIGADSILAGGLTVANLRFLSGATIGNQWNQADVVVTGLLTNSNINASVNMAWLNVRNGAFTLASGSNVSPKAKFNVDGDGMLVAGAGAIPVPISPTQLQAQPGGALASEVKVVDGQRVTGTFTMPDAFNLNGWKIAVKTAPGVRPPVKTPVLTLTSGEFTNFNPKAIPEGVKSRVLVIDGATLYSVREPGLTLLFR